MNFIVGRENSREDKGKNLKGDFNPALSRLQEKSNINKSHSFYAAENNLPGKFTKNAEIIQLPKKPESKEKDYTSKPLIPENFDYQKLKKVESLLESIENLKTKPEKREHQAILLKTAQIMLQELDLLKKDEELESEDIPGILEDLAA